MGGLGDLLFGSSQDAKQTGTAATLTPGQTAVLDRLTGILSGQIGQGMIPYNAELAPGPQPLQSAAFNNLQNLLSGGSMADTLKSAMSLTPTNLPYAAGNMPITPQYFTANPQLDLSSTPQYEKGWGTLQNVLDTGLQTDVSANPSYQLGGRTLTDLMKPWDPTTATEYWKSTYVNPEIDTWKKDIAPAINEKYIARNAQYSQALPDALAKSATTMNTNLDSQLANILYQGEQANKQQQQFAVNEALQYAGLPASLAESAAARRMSGINEALNYGTSPLQMAMNQASTYGGLGLTAQGQGLTAQGQQLSTQNDLLDAITSGRSSDLNSILAGLQGGSTQYGIQSALDTAQKQNWLSGQPYANPWLSYLGSVLGTSAFQPIVQGPTQTEGLVQALLKGGGQGVGQAMGAKAGKAIFT